MKCHFTDKLCDGGAIYANGTVGCGYKEKMFDPCELLEDVPDGIEPREWYESLMDDMAEKEGKQWRK